MKILVTTAMAVASLAIMLGDATATSTAWAPPAVVSLPSHHPFFDWYQWPQTHLEATIQINQAGHSTYFQAFDGEVGGIQQYFGVQSAFDGKCIAIWSQFRDAPFALGQHTQAFETTPADPVRGDGVFTSLRQRIACPRAGDVYRFTLSETHADWFRMVLNGHLLGEMQFPGRTIGTTGGSWVEFFPNNYSAHPAPVPHSSAVFRIKE